MKSLISCSHQHHAVSAAALQAVLCWDFWSGAWCAVQAARQRAEERRC